MADKPFDKKEYDKQFLKDNYKWINLGFNQNVPEEKELYDFVKSQPQKVPFVKNLIRNALKEAKKP